MKPIGFTGEFPGTTPLNRIFRRRTAEVEIDANGRKERAAETEPTGRDNNARCRPELKDCRNWSGSRPFPWPVENGVTVEVAAAAAFGTPAEPAALLLRRRCPR